MELAIDPNAKAKRIIYLFQSGGPSHLDLFDYKPLLNEKNGEQIPAHVRGDQRLTGMSSFSGFHSACRLGLQIQAVRASRNVD